MKNVENTLFNRFEIYFQRKKVLADVEKRIFSISQYFIVELK